MGNDDTKYFVSKLMPHHNRLFSYILKMVPNYSDAEDVMQEVVSLLWKKTVGFCREYRLYGLGGVRGTFQGL